MALDLQTILVLVGILVIVTVLVHGWLKMKRRSDGTSDSAGGSATETGEGSAASERTSYDMDGIGELRVRAEPQFGDGATEEAGDEDADAGAPVEEVFAINVMSKNDEQFNGAIILQTLLSLGFRYGDMNIFHRHREARGKGPVLFSLANAVKPGTFDLDNIDTFYTPGLTLFMQLPGPQDPAAAYELMLDTAKRMASELEGLLLDGNRSTLTHQAQQHDRERIREYTRRRMALQKA